MFFRVENLIVKYGKSPALNGISISVGSGECVCIIGANGAGKTTTMKAICGLIKPAGGAIYFKEKRIDSLTTPKIVSEGISLVPEGRWIFSDMSVIDNLHMGAYSRKGKQAAGIKDDLEKIFQLFPILRKRQRQAGGSLSGGEQQMLTIGRAMMNNPKLLLLDEPTVGLAPIIVTQIAKIIKNINKQGTTVILVEQNSRMALAVSVKGYVLETGRILLEDLSDNLLNNDFVKEAYLGG